MRQEKFLEFYRGFYPSIAEFLTEDDIKDLRFSLFCSAFVEFEEIVRANDPIPSLPLTNDFSSFDHSSLFETIIKSMEVDENLSFLESQSSLSMLQNPSQIFDEADMLPKFTTKNDKPFNKTVQLPKTFSIRSSNPMLKNSEKAFIKTPSLNKLKLPAPARKTLPQKSSLDFLQMRILQAFSINEEMAVDGGSFVRFMQTKKEELDSINKELVQRSHELKDENWLGSFQQKNRLFEKLSKKLIKYLENGNLFFEKIIEPKSDSAQRTKFFSMLKKVANSQFFFKVILCFIVTVISVLHDRIGFNLSNITKSPSIFRQRILSVIDFLNDLEKTTSISQVEHHCTKMIEGQKEVFMFYQSFTDLIIAEPTTSTSYVHFPIKDNFCRPEKLKDFQKFRLSFMKQLKNFKSTIN